MSPWGFDPASRVDVPHNAVLFIGPSLGQHPMLTVKDDAEEDIRGAILRMKVGMALEKQRLANFRDHFNRRNLR